MDCKLELIALPVADVDRAVGSYVGELGWTLDHEQPSATKCASCK